MKRNNLKRVDVIPTDLFNQAPDAYRATLESMVSLIRTHERTAAVDRECAGRDYVSLLRIARLSFYANGQHNDPRAKMLTAVINQMPIAQYN